jgi:hypothetical protein
MEYPLGFDNGAAGKKFTEVVAPPGAPTMVVVAGELGQ